MNLPKTELTNMDTNEKIKENLKNKLWKSGIWETLSHDQLIALDKIVLDFIHQAEITAIKKYLLNNSTPTGFEIKGEPVRMIRFTQSDIQALEKEIK